MKRHWVLWHGTPSGWMRVAWTWTRRGAYRYAHRRDRVAREMGHSGLYVARMTVMGEEFLVALNDLARRMLDDGDDYVYDYGRQLRELLAANTATATKRKD